MSHPVEELFPYLWLEAVEPWTEEERAERLAAFGGEVPEDVDVFYGLCDGGEIPSIECRFYGLDEAAEVAAHLCEPRTDLRMLPVFVSQNAESDPVCVVLSPPLQGLVVQLCHDTPSRALASSFTTLLEAIAETEDVLDPSRYRFEYPRRLKKHDRALAEALVDRAEKLSDGTLVSDCESAEYEPALLLELARSMTTPKAMPELFDPLDMPDGKSRRDVATALYYAGTPAATKTLERYCRTMAEFAEELVAAIGSEGEHPLTLGEHEGITPTRWIHYRGRQVLVDDVYSTDPPPQRWKPIREFTAEMDAIIAKFDA